MNYLLIFLGGGAGSLLRFALGQWFQPWSLKFPASTLLSNVIASLLIGIVYLFTLQKNSALQSTIWSLAAIGFCGGLSTFSAFSFETVKLFRDGMVGLAWVNIVLSIVCCLLMVWVVVRR